LSGGSLDALRTRPGWLVSLSIQVIVLVAIPALSAIQEFCQRGLGTPLPYDAPQRLVTTGVYAYLANPMQVSTVLVVFLLGLMLGSPWIAAGGIVALAYGQASRPGTRRRRAAGRSSAFCPMGAWLPLAALVPVDARLYVAEGCEPCSEVGPAAPARTHRNDILAAEDHPARDLQR
jgi:protein-S-isoprenylcysteine O-methyltransferase Ste14